MKLARYSWLLVAAGCAATVEPSSGGSESHFLQSCVETSDCGSGLYCHANLCTAECESAASCNELAQAATCEASDELRVCDVLCADAGECRALGDGFECNGGRCRKASERDGLDASVDASAAESNAELLGTSDPLGDSIELAFVTTEGDAQHVWVRSADGALRQVDAWPPDVGWQDDACDGVPLGWDGHSGRFASLVLDGAGEHLVFVEYLSCYGSEARLGRFVVYEAATGRSWALGTFTDWLEVTAGPRSIIASVIEGSFFEVPASLYEIDPAAKRLTRFETPSGNLVNGNSQQVSGIGGLAEIVIALGQPVMLLRDAELRVIEAIEALGPTQLGDLSASPSGEHVCITAREISAPPGADDGIAVVITADGATTRSTGASFDFKCAFSGDGRRVMFGGAPFEIEGDALVALPLPNEPFSLEGSFGDDFYGFNGGEVVRFNPRLGSAVEVVVGMDVLEPLCQGNPRQDPITHVFFAPDNRGVAVVKHFCGDDDVDASASLALDLSTGSYATIELGGEVSRSNFEVVWPREGGALIFSTLEGSTSSSFYAVSSGPEIEVRAIEGTSGVIHDAAALR